MTRPARSVPVPAPASPPTAPRPSAVAEAPRRVPWTPAPAILDAPTRADLLGGDVATPVDLAAREPYRRRPGLLGAAEWLRELRAREDLVAARERGLDERDAALAPAPPREALRAVAEAARGAGMTREEAQRLFVGVWPMPAKGAK